MTAAPVRYLDSHCHLQAGRLTPTEEGTTGRTRMLCNATSEADWQAVLALATARQEVVPFLGIHPWFAASAGAGWEQRLRALLEQIQAGIGETGLDRCCRTDFASQQRIFVAQLQMASELRRPLVIHCVKAWGRLLELLEQNPAPLPPIMIHAFSGSTETLQRLIRCGCFISYSTRLATESKLHPSCRATPLTSLLLETDAPAQLNNKIAFDEPAAIKGLYQLAADLRGMALNEFCREIWNNGEIFTDTILPR